MRKIVSLFLFAFIFVFCFLGCSEASPEPVAESEGFTTMFYLDISTLDGMNNFDLLIESNPTVSDKFAIYYITGGINTPEKEYDHKNNPFEKDADGLYVYPYLAAALKKSGFADDGTNPFAPSFIPDSYQFWTYKADEDGNGVLAELTNPLKLMSDGDVLTGFINFVYAATKNNNTKYILHLFDHGNGSVSGLLYDSTVSPNPSMSIQTWYDAIKKSEFIKAGKRFEAVSLDLCLMQTIENINLMRDFTKCMIASETISFDSGYGDYFKYLSDNPKADYKGVAVAFIDGAVKYHNCSYIMRDAYTWSAVDLTSSAAIDALNSAYVAFIADVAADSVNDYANFKAAAANSVNYYNNEIRKDNYDIIGVASRFYGDNSNEHYSALRDALRKVVIYNKFGENYAFGTDGNAPGSEGLAFFFCPELGKNIGPKCNYTEEQFENYCERIDGYFSSTVVSDFYKAYRKATE